MNKNKKKKVIAILTALVVLATGTLGGLHACKRNTDDNDKSNEKDGFEHVLYLPTDMNNNEEFQKLLSEIEKVTGQKIDKDIVKFFNHNVLNEENRLTKANYENMTDEEIADVIYNYAIEYYDFLADDDFMELIELKADVLTQSELEVKDDYKIATSFTTTDKNSYLYETYQNEYDTVIDDEIEDIVTSNEQDFVKNAKAFYDIVSKILKDPEVSKNPDIKAMFVEGAKIDYALFASILKANYPEYYAELQKEFENNILNEWVGTFLDCLAIVVDAVDCTEKTKTTEKYVEADKSLAKAYEKAVNDGKVQTVTSKNKVTSTEVISQGTTSVTTSTTIHTVPKTEQEKAETTTRKSNNSEPVGEPSTKVETTTKLYEEVVKPEEETTKVTTTKPSTESTATTAVYETYESVTDEDGIYYFDEEEWEKLQGTSK